MHQPAAAFDREQNVDAFKKAADGVSQAALAHTLDLFHRAPRRGNRRLQSSNQLVLLFLRHIRPDNKHQFISTIHCASPNSVVGYWSFVAGFKDQRPMTNDIFYSSGSSGFRLNRFIAAARPSFKITST